MQADALTVPHSFGRPDAVWMMHEPKGSKIPKHRVSMVSILGAVIVVLG